MSTNRKQTLVLSLLLALCFAMTAAFSLSSISNALIFSLLFLAGITVWQHQQASKAFLLLEKAKRNHVFFNQQLAVIECNTEGHISSANDNLLALIDQTGERITGTTMTQVFADNAEAMMAKNISNAIEIIVPTSTGDKPIEVERHATENGFIFFFSDLTESKELEKLTITDPLTKTKNRQAFEAEIGNMTNRAQRQDQYLSLAIIDIDNFNDFNEQFGHEEGDKALVKLADSLRHTLRRATDHIYRIGGDEFVAVFEGDSPNICRRALENLIADFENHHLPNPSPSPTADPFLTLSAGAFGAKGKQLGDSDQLYMNADVQLFNAKENKNSFCYLFPEIGKPICVEPLAKRLEETEQTVD